MPTLAELKAELNRAPNDPAAHIAYGRGLEAEQRFDEAARAYFGALELDSENAEACFRLGMMRMLDGDAETALPLLIQAVNLDEGNGLYWSNLGMLLLLLEQKEEALAAFEASWEVAPELEQTPLHIARLQFELGQYDKVLELEKELTALGGSYPEASILHASSLLALTRAEEAAAIAEEAAIRFTDQPDVLATAGGILAFQDKFDQARDLFKRALARNPQHYDALVGLGALLSRTDAPGSAENCYRKALDADPQRVQAYVGLCSLAFQADDPQRLLHWARAGLQHAPNNPDLLYYKARVLSRLGQIDSAVKTLEQLLDVNPFHYQGHFELANLCELELNDRARSQVHLKAVIEIAPDSAAARVAGMMLSKG
ncbi:tetratricopeptide repeat protein [Azospirillum sp. B2RO_4]|uniref:tetratricopeptide repeat protein n=1 Tax=Azospirillum sp. B2RO_4 TaxID=3027796 RepID=UPI003DA8D1A3